MNALECGESSSDNSSILATDCSPPLTAEDRLYCQDGLTVTGSATNQPGLTVAVRPQALSDRSAPIQWTNAPPATIERSVSGYTGRGKTEGRES